ncbi:hypothetical protein [Streptomyces sp. G45]|uniref:hypothetical protein n=1 Tax=Streptomyces sp. G45 TaxID=3406627 RepID=UPI003C227EE7
MARPSRRHATPPYSPSSSSSSPSPSSSPARALLRAGVALGVAGVALGAGGAGAVAAPAAAPAEAPASGLSGLGNLDATTAGEGLLHGLGQAVRPVKRLQLDPLAGTGVDPLDNAVGTQVADFKPVSSAVATAPITQGGSISDLPVVGAVANALPG